MSLGDEKYLAVTTYRRTGEGVTTPTWCVTTDDGRIGFWTAMGTGKTKRIRHTPRTTVQPCDARGKVKDGTSPVEGSAELVQSGPVFDEVQRKVKEKYRFMVPLTRSLGKITGQRKAGQTYADTVVLITLPQT